MRTEIARSCVNNISLRDFFLGRIDVFCVQNVKSFCSFPGVQVLVECSPRVASRVDLPYSLLAEYVKMLYKLARSTVRIA